MATNLELFYFPQSYYSQKAYLTLFEKNLPFKKRYVYIHFGEQNEDWYLRLNPNGQVPTLKDGSDVICGSEEIIDYVDGKSDKGVRLVPDVTTPLGRRVADIRQWVNDIRVETVTYGLLLHPGLQAKPPRVPAGFRNNISLESFEKSTLANLASFKARQKAEPHLHDAMARKIESTQWKLDNLLEEQGVRKVLADLHLTFDRIEQELVKSQKETGKDDVWVCGTSYTAADVVMVILFNRLHLMGLEDEYYSASKRPLVSAYQQRLYGRPAVQMLLKESSPEHMVKLFRQKMMKNATKKALKVVLVAGVVAAVAYGVKEYMNKK